MYVIWGSTYLAIRFSVATIPPLLVAGIRFLAAGSALYLIVRVSGTPRPTRSQWKQAAIIGSLMLVWGNGLVCWAEQTVPSGMTSLIIASMPIWMLCLDVAFFGARRPSARVSLGLIIGLVGVAVLLGRDQLLGQPVDPWGALGLLVACCFWAFGSLRTRKADLPASPFLTSAMEMSVAGAILLLLAMLVGDWHRMDWSSVSVLSVWSLAYLTVLGSMIALSAYAWLLKNCDAARVSTYAYVNPIVAVVLGAVFDNEEVSARIGLGAALILSALVLVGVGRRRPQSGVTNSESSRTQEGTREPPTAPPGERPRMALNRK